MWKKLSHILTISIFLVIFGYVFGEDYWGFQSERKSQIEYNIRVEDHSEDFSPEMLEDFQDTTLHVSPNLSLLDQLVQEINSAQKRLYVEVYIFTEKRLRDALISAHARGVDVKVLLENNPYKAPYLNDNHYEALRNAGIDVRWSDPLNYSLNHSKLLIIDNRAYVSTGNFSYSLFKSNRDFLVEVQDEEILKALEQVFLNDFSHKKLGVIHPNIVLSPEYSRAKIEKLILLAQESIDMYFPYISDDRMQEMVFTAAENGVDIRFIVEEDFYDENPDIIKEYRENNIAISPLTGTKLHAKAILVDDEYLYIGSINFSRYSFDENREIGLLLTQKEVIEKFKQIFISDL